MDYLMAVLIILALVLWVWAVYDINISRLKGKNHQNKWLLAVVIFPLLGPILYFQLKRKG